MNRGQDYITEVRTLAKQFLAAYQGLIAHQLEWNALDYGNTLPDGVGENSGITKIEVGAVVFDSANAVKAVLDAGNATNIAKLL